MTEHQVVIAGAGPTGMMLAAELTLAGVDVVVLERQTTPDIAVSRGLGLHTRTLEVFDQRGIVDRFLAEGQPMQVMRFADVVLDQGDSPTRHPYGLALFQIHTERIMRVWISELGVKVQLGREVTGFTQDDTGVTIALAGGDELRAQYLVGCDGGRSVIRKTAEIEFPGFDATTSWLMAELETTDEPAWGFRHDTDGRTHAIGKADTPGKVRVVLMEKIVGVAGEPTLREISDVLMGAYGTDFGIHSPSWITRFTDMTRQAARYRDRRVLLAGDAAHIHAPMGGHGLNMGVQDAVNLGWKLAQVVKRISPDSLLDTYHAERHPADARLLRHTMAHVALGRTDDRTKALKEILGDVLRQDEARRFLAADAAGLNVRYDLGPGHPLLGRRMPDLDLVADDESIRLFTLLHDARAVLINFGEPGLFDITPWSDRVQLVDAQYAGPWELPAIGGVSAPGAVLVRPDGYVAWVGDRTAAGLAEALTTWFGGR